MKYTKLLRTFVNIFYYLGIVAFIVIPIAGIYLLTQVYNDGFKNEDKIFVEIGYDYILKIYVKDMDEYRDFMVTKLTAIKYIGSTHSIFSIEQVKNTTAIKL